jgi:hypothetical protein
MIGHPSRVTYARGSSLTHPARDVTNRPNDYYKSGMRRLVRLASLVVLGPVCAGADWLAAESSLGA